ncbi:hypothetical protein [Salicola sp. Rm-C-2C1-2]|uniref:hypothetical protein n=1 Tax=Salicola sp. Rm-C-2C1-2 TaxID=3141321 RepID=UPI0032E50CE8
MDVRRIGSLLLGLALAFSLFAQAQAQTQKVQVAGYRFPPFVMMENGGHTGLTLEVIEALNDIQTQYEFEFFLTSSKRRYLDHKKGFYDLILFEDRRWEWRDRPVSGTRVIARDEEVFVAHSRQAHGEDFFQDLEERQMVGMLGFHYQFANHVTDTGFLDTKFDMLLSSSLKRNLKLIRLDRPSLAEVAVVPRSFLNLYLSRHPDARQHLTVSDRVDQVYQLRALVRDSSPIPVESLDRLLGQLEKSDRLTALRRKYHLPPMDKDTDARSQ